MRTLPLFKILKCELGFPPLFQKFRPPPSARGDDRGSKRYTYWGDGSIYLLGGWVEIFEEDEYPHPDPPGFAPLNINSVSISLVLY